MEKLKVFDGESGDISTRQFCVLVSRYNRPITEKLLNGSLERLTREGAADENVQVIWVPGAWELAVLASQVIDDFDAVICLGAVIKGDTTHDQYINSMLSTQLGRLSVQSKKPIGFGLLTCNTVDQAVQRSGGSVGNKGEEAAAAVIEVLRAVAAWQKSAQ